MYLQHGSYFLFEDLVPRDILAQWDQNFSEVYMQQIHKLVVAFFLNILKVVFLLLQGGPPPAPPAAPRGAGLSARRLCKISRGGTNNLSLVRSSSVQTGKCILYAEKFMPGRKKLAEELFFP